MRIWHILAFVLTSLLATAQAEAVNWVRYTVSGKGTTGYLEQTFDGFIYITRQVDWSAYFSVDTDPADLDLVSYFSNGTFFNYYGGPFTLLASGTPTSLKAAGSLLDTKIYGNYSLNVAFTGYSPGNGFATSIQPSTATGTVYHLLSISTPLGGREYTLSGTVDRITVGPTTGFEDFNFSATPEPATWLMLICGIGAIGSGLRRQRSRNGATTGPLGRA